jgi:hypothetical protein
MYNRLTIFINFRDNKSTEMANQLFIVNIQESMDEKLYVLGLFFDLSNVINHEILLNKLEYYGIGGTIKKWIKSYPSQFVEIFKTDNRGRNQQIYKSLCNETKHRFPQGSVLGPLWFYYLYK